MTETSTGLKRLKGLLPDGTVVAHKTGTSSTVNGVTAATNDVELVTLPNGQHLAIASLHGYVLAELVEDMAPPPSRAKLLEVLESLSWRNLIERRQGSYMQQSVVMEYCTEVLIEQVAIELVSQEINLFVRSRGVQMAIG